MPFTILHTESSTGWGGQENRTLNESIGLKRLGAHVIILCQPGSMLEKKASAEGIEVKTCVMKKSYDVRAVKYILDVIRNEKVDIINTHSGRDGLLGGIAGRLSRRKPVIVRTRHLALPITSKFSYKILPHRIITVSEYVRNYLIRQGISPEKVIAVPTGVDIKKFDPEKINGNLKKELGLKSDAPLIGTVAILRLKKGHHILLDAIPAVLEKIPDASFVFAGDGPQKQNILNKIQNMRLTGSVFLLGLRKDIPEILKSIDIFVLPTLQEALGTSFVEAMAMGKPVIGTDVGGVSEVIKNGVNGYLVEPDNPLALANAIIGALQDNEKLNIMGIEGRKIVEQNYTVKKMCEKMHGIYTSLLKDKNS